MLAGLEEERFLVWQSQHDLALGRGGQFYSRQDVLTLRSISPTIIKMQNQPRLEDVLDDLNQFGRTVDEAKEKLVSVLTRLQEQDRQVSEQ